MSRMDHAQDSNTDSNTFIHHNYMILTWIDTLALVMNNFRILSMSPSYNR